MTRDEKTWCVECGLTLAGVGAGAALVTHFDSDQASALAICLGGGMLAGIVFQIAQIKRLIRIFDHWMEG